MHVRRHRWAHCVWFWGGAGTLVLLYGLARSAILPLRYVKQRSQAQVDNLIAGRSAWSYLRNPVTIKRTGAGQHAQHPRLRIVFGPSDQYGYDPRDRYYRPVHANWINAAQDGADGETGGLAAWDPANMPAGDDDDDETYFVNTGVGFAPGEDEVELVFLADACLAENRTTLLRTIAEGNYEAFGGRSVEERITEMELIVLRTRPGKVNIPNMLVAFNAGKVIGSVRIVDDDFCKLRPLYSPWLATLWVRPDGRGQGIGSQLVRAGELAALSTGADLVYLWAGSAKAEEFYKRLKFEVVERTGAPKDTALTTIGEEVAIMRGEVEFDPLEEEVRRDAQRYGEKEWGGRIVPNSPDFVRPAGKKAVGVDLEERQKADLEAKAAKEDLIRRAKELAERGDFEGT